MLGTYGNNAALGQAGANLASSMGQARANTRQNIAGMQVETEDRDQTQTFDAYNQMLDRYAQQYGDAYGRARDFLGMKQQNLISQAGMISGVPFTIPQSTAGRDMAQNVLQQQQIGASRQSQKGSFMFFDVGGGCIDAQSKVTTRRGLVSVAGVLPGDEVLGSDGEFHRVLGKDCGTVPEESQHDMVQIVAGASCIVATPDHVIDGKSAGKWVEGDTITVDGQRDRVESVGMVPYRPAADLILEGADAYVADGFPVESVIGRQGIDAWRKALASEDHVLGDEVICSPINLNGVWAVAQ
jgi:hypothetical protein